MTTQNIQEAVKPILAKIRTAAFTAEYRDQATDEECMGLLVSEYFEWAGKPILVALIEALEDSNYHSLVNAINELPETKETLK